MKEILKKNREVIMYLIFGVLTTLVNIVVYIVSTRLFNINEYVSNIIAWILSVLFAYITNKTYVFQSKRTSCKAKIYEFLSFYGFRILSLMIDMSIMYILIDVISVNDMISKVISNIVVIIANYIFSKLLIFKK